MDIITGRNTELVLSRNNKNDGWLRMELTSGDNLWLEFTTYDLRYCENQSPNVLLNKAIILEKLPKKAALLLAVIHRPLYNIYKKYLENRK